MFLVNPEKRDCVRERLKHLIHVSVGIDTEGSRIVLRCGDSAGSIYVVSTLGGLPRKVGEGELPQFSPDGSRIAFLTPAPGNAPSRTIRIVRADGSSSTDITIAKTLFGGPVWSPDGRGLFVVGFNDSSASDRDWYFASAENGALTPTGALARLQATSSASPMRSNVTVCRKRCAISSIGSHDTR